MGFSSTAPRLPRRAIAVPKYNFHPPFIPTRPSYHSILTYREVVRAAGLNAKLRGLAALHIEAATNYQYCDKLSVL